MRSKSNDALELAKKIRKKLSNKEIILTSMLQDCKTICRYLGISDKNEWINLELNGYIIKKTDSLNDEETIIPQYRYVYQIFYDQNNNIVRMDTENTNIYGKLSLRNSAAEIMKYKNNEIIIRNSPALDLLNSEEFKKQHNVPLFLIVQYGKVSASNVAKVINGIESRIYEFLDNIILELEYGQIPENIFYEIRKEVDEKLIKLCPIAIKKLLVIYEQLNSNDNVTYSQIAGTCRQIINDVANSLYATSQSSVEQKNNIMKLDNDKPLNRILSSISSKSEKSVFKSMFEYTDNFLHSLQKYASKGDHSNFKKNDAIRCVVYTYILLGDIVHYYAIDTRKSL